MIPLKEEKGEEKEKAREGGKERGRERRKEGGKGGRREGKREGEKQSMVIAYDIRLHTCKGSSEGNASNCQQPPSVEESILFCSVHFFICAVHVYNRM